MESLPIIGHGMDVIVRERSNRCSISVQESWTERSPDCKWLPLRLIFLLARRLFELSYLSNIDKKSNE